MSVLWSLQCTCIFFLLEGARSRDDQTPHELGMEDGDAISVMQTLRGPPEKMFMANHAVSSIPNSGGTFLVNTEISVIFRRSLKEPTYHRPSRREITLTAFVDAADPLSRSIPRAAQCHLRRPRASVDQHRTRPQVSRRPHGSSRRGESRGLSRIPYFPQQLEVLRATSIRGSATPSRCLSRARLRSTRLRARSASLPPNPSVPPRRTGSCCSTMPPRIMGAGRMW